MNSLKNKFLMFQLKFLFYAILLQASDVVVAQPIDTLWTKTFGGTNIDIGHSVQQTSDSGYIITGYTRSYGTMSGRNVWLIKTDINGNEEWNNAFGGNSDDEGHFVQQTSDGSFIITGLTKSFGAGLNDVYLIKTNSSGNLIWTKTFGGTQDDEGYCIVESDDGSYVIAGVTSSFGSGSRDVWLIKTDTAGSTIWTKTFGGLSSDGAWSVNKTTDGGYIITGWTFSYGPGSIGNVFLVKTDSAGNQQWYKAFGGTDVDRGYEVEQTTDGGYIVTGYTSSSGAGLDDMLVIKTDSLGNETWTKTFGGTGRDYGNSVTQTSDGGFIIAGYTLSFGAGGDDVWLVKTDGAGNEMWNKTFGGSSSDVAFSVIETFDGSFVVTGHTLSYGAGVHDVWLIKAASAIPVELISFSGTYENGNITLTWITASELNNLGFEIERRQLSSKQSATCGSIGNEEWNSIGFVMGNGTTTQAQSYSFIDKNLPAGRQCVSDSSYSYRLKQIDFDGNSKYSEIVSIDVTFIKNFELFQNYPNPFNPRTKISWQSPVDGHQTIKVFDVLGNEIAILIDEYKPAGRYEIEFNSHSGEVRNLPSGVYFYKLRTDSFAETKKMLMIK